MKANTRDLLIGIASIVFSVCAGGWTLWNYQMNRDKIDLESVFSITKKLEFIKLKRMLKDVENFLEKTEDDSEKVEDETKLLHELLSEVRHRFHQIKRPSGVSKSQWEKNWIHFYKSIQEAFKKGFAKEEEEIDKYWKKILEEKGIDTIDKLAED